MTLSLCVLRILNPFSFNRKKPKVQIVQCPQQTNSYDCGAYSILFSLEFCKFISTENNTILVEEKVQEWMNELSAHLTNTITTESSLNLRLQLKQFVRDQIK